MSGRAQANASKRQPPATVFSWGHANFEKQKTHGSWGEKADSRHANRPVPPASATRTVVIQLSDERSKVGRPQVLLEDLVGEPGSRAHGSSAPNMRAKKREMNINRDVFGAAQRHDGESAPTTGTRTAQAPTRHDQLGEEDCCSAPRASASARGGTRKTALDSGYGHSPLQVRDQERRARLVPAHDSGVTFL
jgi:hypothetical protein